MKNNLEENFDDSDIEESKNFARCQPAHIPNDMESVMLAKDFLAQNDVIIAQKQPSLLRKTIEKINIK